MRLSWASAVLTAALASGWPAWAADAAPSGPDAPALRMPALRATSTTAARALSAQLRRACASGDQEGASRASQRLHELVRAPQAAAALLQQVVTLDREVTASRSQRNADGQQAWRQQWYRLRLVDVLGQAPQRVVWLASLAEPGRSAELRRGALDLLLGATQAAPGAVPRAVVLDACVAAAVDPNPGLNLSALSALTGVGPQGVYYLGPIQRDVGTALLHYWADRPEDVFTRRELYVRMLCRLGEGRERYVPEYWRALKDRSVPAPLRETYVQLLEDWGALAPADAERWRLAVRSGDAAPPTAGDVAAALDRWLAADGADGRLPAVWPGFGRLWTAPAATEKRNEPAAGK